MNLKWAWKMILIRIGNKHFRTREFRTDQYPQVRLYKADEEQLAKTIERIRKNPEWRPRREKIRQEQP